MNNNLEEIGDIRFVSDTVLEVFGGNFPLHTAAEACVPQTFHRGNSDATLGQRGHRSARLQGPWTSEAKLSLGSTPAYFFLTLSY